MKSILDQTVKDWELIISDNYSDDGSWEFLQKFADDPRIRMFQTPRKGMYANWNECLKMATAEFVYVATADDTCHVDLLSRMLTGLERYPVLDVAVCDLEFIDTVGAVTNNPMRWLAREFYGEWIRTRHIRDGRTEFIIHARVGIVWWSITAVVFRRSLLDRIGMFRTDRGSQADEEWEMRAALASDILFIPERLATWRVHPQQATAQLRHYNRTVLDGLEAVLHDPSACIPERWRGVRGWDRKIAHGCRLTYLESFGLTRDNALQSPCDFLRGLSRSLRREPLFALRQALRGFGWSREYFSPDPVAELNDLIRLLGCQWPPLTLAQYEKQVESGGRAFGPDQRPFRRDSHS